MGFFDHFAQSSITPFGQWMVESVKQREFAVFRQCLPNLDSAILEIGPGNGEMARILREAGYHRYAAIEPNPRMRDRLISEGFTVKDYRIPHLQELDNTYDAIILMDVFEHLNGTQATETFVAEAYRILRPGGILHISAPDYRHWGQEFFLSDYTHSNIASARRTLQLFQDNGFTSLKTTYLSGFFIGPMATFLSHLTRILAFFIHSDKVEDKLYKLKLSFLRRFLVIGQKQLSIL